MERDNADDTKFQEIVNFNSHAHVERDEVAENSYIHMEISTHTLTWSVTGVHEEIYRRVKFQLTRSRGA